MDFLDYQEPLNYVELPQKPMPAQAQPMQPQHFLSPAELQQLTAAFGGEERGKQLEEQLAQAKALMQPGPQHSTGLGAALGGLAGALNTYTGTREQQKAHAEQAKQLELQRAVYQTLLGRANDQDLLAGGNGIALFGGGSGGK